MSVDTALKRRAAGAVTGVPLCVGVLPDVTKPQAWRQTAGWGYPEVIVVRGEVVKARYVALFPNQFLADNSSGGYAMNPSPSSFLSEE